METIVINLIAGPCSGKSTIASGIFYELKRRDINCELSLEFAKNMIYDESFKMMDDQIYLFAKQYHKLWSLRNKVNVIITDAPLPMSLIYMKEPSEYFGKLILEQYNKFNNWMFFIERSEEYQQEGRTQTKEESIALDEQIKQMLVDNHIEYSSVKQKDAVLLITDLILSKLKQ